MGAKLFGILSYLFQHLLGKYLLYIRPDYISPTKLAVKSNYGFWYAGNVFNQQDIAYGVASNGTVEAFDTEIVNKILSLLPPDFVLYDIGANTGWYSMLATSVSDKANVISFEPVHEHVGILEQSIFLNRVEDRVTVIETALSDEKGVAEILLAGTGSSLEKTFLDKNTGVRTIKKEKLDNLTSLPHPSFIKIDVEGHEYKVLLGGKRLLQETKPILFIEIAATLKNLKRTFVHPDYQKIFSLLGSLNYEAFVLKDGKVSSCDESVAYDESYMFLFIERKKHANIKALFSQY